MSDTQGDQPVSVKSRIVLGSFLAAVVAAAAVFVGVAAHNAQVQADAQKAMTAAAPAYQGAISLGGDLDQLAAQSVQAKAAYDAEQQRLAAEKAAQEAEAARVALEQQAQQQAQQERQAQQEAASDDSSGGDTGGDTGSGDPAQPSSGKLPAGSPVPWIANPDPQDTAGGRWDTSACASGSASGNPAICD